MTSLLDILGQWVINHYAWRHLIIAAGIFIQGEITILIGVYLILNKYLGWGGFLLAIGVGLLFYESFFYMLGRVLKDTPFGLRLERKIPYHAKARFLLHNHADKFLIISRFLAYVNVGAIFLSGWIKIDLKKFLVHRITANVIWVSAVMGGAFFVVGGLGLLRLRQMEIAIVIILVLIFGGKHLLKKILGKEAVIENKAKEIGDAIDKSL